MEQHTADNDDWKLVLEILVPSLDDTADGLMTGLLEVAV